MNKAQVDMTAWWGVARIDRVLTRRTVLCCAAWPCLSYPTIDFEADGEELSADEDEDIVARYVSRLGGRGALVLDATRKKGAPILHDHSSDEEW